MVGVWNTTVDFCDQHFRLHLNAANYSYYCQYTQCWRIIIAQLGSLLKHVLKYSQLWHTDGSEYFIYIDLIFNFGLLLYLQFQDAVVKDMDKSIAVIVIGPLAKAERDRVITLHELLKFLDSKSSNLPEGGNTPPCLADKVVLIVLKPTNIEGSLTGDDFCDFEPAKRYGASCLL